MKPLGANGQEVDSTKNAFERKLPVDVRFEVGACDCYLGPRATAARLLIKVKADQSAGGI